MRTLYGVFGVVGRWKHWRRFFALDRAGLVRSFAALLLCFPALWFVLTGSEAERAAVLDRPAPDLSAALFALIVGAWILSFHLTSGLIAVLMNRAERLTDWWTVRNWALVWLSLALGAVFALVPLGLPLVVANGVLFAAYLGLLPIDIRIAQRVAGFPVGSAVLVACVVVSTSMMVLLTGILQVLQ